MDAVLEARAVVLENRAKPSRVEHKGRIDLVTETDLQVEKLLKQRLSQIMPEASFLAEETDAEGSLDDPCWIVDPLDGTTNFAHRLPVHACSVALWRGARMELGIIDVPVLGELFHAVAGGGAFLNGEAISVTDTADPEQALVATGFPYAIRENIRPVMDCLEKALVLSRGVRRMGAAAVDLAYVAAGRFDAFYEMLLHPWDTAAGMLLVQEAGGRVSNFRGGGYDIFQETVLATNGPLHGSFVEMLGECAGRAGQGLQKTTPDSKR